MARRGRFGRIPRSAPDLTGTIVALLRERDSQRERNITDAWKNGGTFEGEKATDQMLLNFYEKRQKGLGKNDPLYEAAKNTVQQYEFSIANSKMELKYAEKKVGDMDMARFYRQWSNKLPKDSEAWRQQQKLAAQYADRAQSGAAARGRAASDKKYYAEQDRARKKEIPFDTMTDAITGLALREGILNKKGETLTDLRVFEQDSSRLVELFNAFQNDPAYAPYREQLTRYIKKNGDPDFNGDFSYESWQSYDKMKRAGQDQGLKSSLKAGRKEDANTHRKGMADQTDLMAVTKSIDQMAAYERYRKDTDDVMKDPNSTIAEQWQAAQLYRGKLEGLKAAVEGQGGIGEVNDFMVGHLNNEILALYGKDISAPTLHDASRPSEATPQKPGVGAPGDAEGTSMSMANLFANLGKLNEKDPITGEPMYAQARVSDAGVIGADGAWDVVPRSALPVGTAYVIPQDVPRLDIPQDDGSTTAIDPSSFITGVVGTPIRAKGIVYDESGRAIAEADVANPSVSSEVGTAFVMPDGSALYSYFDSAGKRRFTNVNPFTQDAEGGDAALNKTGAGYEINMRVLTGATGEATLDPSLAVKPDFYLNEINGIKANTVFNSSYAAWMLGNGQSSKGVYADKTENILPALQAEAGGDAEQYTKAAIELDGARASYLTERGDDAQRARRQLIRSAVSGNPPILADAQWEEATGRQHTSMETVRRRLLAGEGILADNYGGKAGDIYEGREGTFAQRRAAAISGVAISGGYRPPSYIAEANKRKARVNDIRDGVFSALDRLTPQAVQGLDAATRPTGQPPGWVPGRGLGLFQPTPPKPAAPKPAAPPPRAPPPKTQPTYKPPKPPPPPPAYHPRTSDYRERL